VNTGSGDDVLLWASLRSAVPSSRKDFLVWASRGGSVVELDFGRRVVRDASHLREPSAEAISVL
jgi:hypothetical protein